jgi:arylsulfatase A-like enzyme
MDVRNQPDILLIVLDTLRADRLSCYGYPDETSPYIDAFSESGVLYQRAISPAQWTIPAHASLFTGEYPTTHRTTQIYDKHSKEQPTLAEILNREGYLTVGFCDNPLLGAVENGLDRGFVEFYNYGGVLPNRPAIADSRARRLGRLTRWAAQTLRHIGTPIQDAFARNNVLLRIALHPLFGPLWHRYLNLKGNTAQLVRDMLGYLRTRQRKGAEQPLFAFVNLMETHLPYRPRPRFVRKIAPWYRQDREARDFIKSYNQQNYRWMVPLREPLTEKQDRTIKDLYASEVAYTDHLLRRLFVYLDEPEVRDNTVVIITSDHGEGLNHHGFVGHSLVAYDDLTHVPLIIRYPLLYPSGQRVLQPVSTRRIFHSVLEAAGIETVFPERGKAERAPVDVHSWSLARAQNGDDPESGIVFTEAFTPDTLIALMKNQDPAAIETYRCRSMRRAVYRDDYKLITVGDKPDELFHVIRDPGELNNLIEKEPMLAAELNGILEEFIVQAEARSPENWEGAHLRLEEDRALADRLRGLGYLG